MVLSGTVLGPDFLDPTLVSPYTPTEIGFPLRPLPMEDAISMRTSKKDACPNVLHSFLATSGNMKYYRKDMPGTASQVRFFNVGTVTHHRR
jgi:hypothetical protein